MEGTRVVQAWYNAEEAADLATWWRRGLSANAATVSVRTIRSWVARGHLAPAGLDEKRRQVFQLVDLARAERATRGRALRLVGLPDPQIQICPPSRAQARSRPYPNS